MCICAAISGTRWTFRVLWKLWKNCGTYGHSRLITVTIRFLLVIALYILCLFHFIMDHQPFFAKDPRNLSVQMRSINSILAVVKCMIPIKQTWPLLNNCLFRWDYIYLQIFNRVINVGMGSLLSIPIMTNITKCTLYGTHFSATCNDALSEQYVVSSSHSNKSNQCSDSDAVGNLSGTEMNEMNEMTESREESPASHSSLKSYADFIPRDVDYFWISGNDQIEALPFEDRFILYLHGGGYSLGGASHMGYVSRLSTCSNTKVLYVDYGKPPKADIPYQVDQILTVYLYMLLYHGIDPKRVVICGDSAGGGLCMLVIQKLSSLGLSHFHPSGIVLCSPWLDLTMEANSWIECQYHDMIVCKTYVGRSGFIAAGNDHKNLRSPFFSAIYAENYDVECNVMILVSKHECLYDDSVTLVKQLREQNTFTERLEGLDDDSDVWNLVIGKGALKELIFVECDYLPHAFALFYGCFPEAQDSMDRTCSAIHRWTEMSKDEVRNNAIQNLPSLD